jgi:leader peptidase (prepilin peptidase)/N-methyltransferase
VTTVPVVLAGLAAASGPWQARAVSRQTAGQPPRPLIVAGHGALTALITLALAARVPVAVLPAAVLLAVGGGPLAVIDARTCRLPDQLLGPTLLAVTAALVLAAALARSPDRLAAALAGAAGMAGFYGLLLLLSAVLGSAAAYGLGDVKLALPVGLVLGWLGLIPWFVGLLGAHLLYVAVHGSRALAGRTGWRSRHAYGPAMLAAALAAALLA